MISRRVIKNILILHLFLTCRHQIYIWTGKLKLQNPNENTNENQNENEILIENPNHKRNLRELIRSIRGAYFENHKHWLNRLIHCSGLICHFGAIYSKDFYRLSLWLLLLELNIVYLEPLGHKLEGNLKETTQASLDIKSRGVWSRIIKANTYWLLWLEDLGRVILRL